MNAGANKNKALGKLLPHVYRNASVASLAWAIYSPPMMQTGAAGLEFYGEEWCVNQFRKHAPWIESLDSDSEPLDKWLDQNEHKLLGKRFESLVSFWFAQSPNFELVQRNILFSEDKNTKGEADLIVRDLEDGALVHIELACKYYLQTKRSSNWVNWVGPNGRDSLQEKMLKLQKQTRLFHSAQGRKKLADWNLEMPKSMVFMKGFFFHHFTELAGSIAPKESHRHYQSGWYCHQKELQQFISNTQQWILLPKSHWTCPYYFPLNHMKVYDGTEIQELCTAELKRTQKSVMLVQIMPDGDMAMEVSRGFVIPKELS